MQALSNSYLAEISQQLAFLGAFLGGFSATFLATLLVVASSKRMAGWVVGSAATAACSFVVAVIASVMLTIVLHPDVPSNVASGASTGTARIVSTLGFGIGVIALLVSVGLSGWVRSRQTGIATSAVASISLVLVLWALGGFS
jgi:hypothetical protein